MSTVAANGTSQPARKRFPCRGKNGALDMKKDADVLEALFAPYAPYRSLAAYYMWRVVDTKAFNQDADA